MANEQKAKGLFAKLFGSKASAEEVFNSKKEILTKEWDDNKGLTDRLNLLNGLSGERYDATIADTTWERDIDIMDKPPVLVRTVTINAQAAGESVKSSETMTFRARVNNDGDFEYKIETSGLAAHDPVTTVGRAKALNTLEEWLVAVQGQYGLATMAADMQKKEQSFTSPAAAPSSPTAKP